MWPYWAMFLVPAFCALLFRSKGGALELATWNATIFACAIMVGFRHEIGPDWPTYELYFDHISQLSFVEAIKFDDPGYYGLNWIVYQLGGDVHWVNMMCGLSIMLGVSYFARAQPYPWVTLAVAVPYLIIVVGMGYSRQGAALGFAVAGLRFLASERRRAFVVAILLGALFHKSAILLLPIAALSATRNRLWTVVWIMVTSGMGAALFLLDRSEELWENYIEAEMQSEGGAIRVAMNAVPSAFYLILGRRLSLSREEGRLWWWISICAFACIPLLRYSSTAVDRVALYFIPIQLVVLSHLPTMRGWALGEFVGLLLPLAYAALVLWVWLTYAVHASLWIPYDIWLPIE